MMLVFQIVVVIVVIVAFILYGSRDLCPQCGTSLTGGSLNPFSTDAPRESCACGWHAHN